MKAFLEPELVRVPHNSKQACRSEHLSLSFRRLDNEHSNSPHDSNESRLDETL